MPAGQQRPSPPAALLRDASLFLDFDGTLVELADSPDAVRVDDRLMALIAGLDRRYGARLALVSGRPVAQLRGFLGGAGLTISGSHGAELHWGDGRVTAPETPGWLDEVVTAMQALAARHHGVLVEVKPFGAALHFRIAPDAADECRLLAEALAAPPGRHLQHGKMMYEVRGAGFDKGDAVRALMADPALAGTMPLFVGDDVTDESAFVAAASFGGAGILVGPERASAAAYRLAGVAATLEWLWTAIEGEA